MDTVTFTVDAVHPDAQAVRCAAEAIRSGKLVAFPTETVYGLAADVFNPDAVFRVCEVKGRRADNPLPVQVADVEDLPRIAAEVPEVVLELARRFMPGPLTIVLRSRPGLPDLVTAGTGTIGLRIPNHPVALELIRAAGRPIVAPSANTSGKPPPVNAEEVRAYLGGRIEYILDAGRSPLGIASTVVDMTGYVPSVLREGAISREELLPFLSQARER